jgi:GC-rich sequence DNA-binding factor
MRQMSLEVSLLAHLVIQLCKPDIATLETAIPSASAISAAKEKRGRLRGTGADDEFISLSVAKAGDVPQGPHPESRLVREEDELGEGEDGM